jgi:hypothetical protein
MIKRMNIIIRLITLALICNFFASCNSPSRTDQRLEGEKKFESAIEKKDFTKAYEEYYLLRSKFGKLDVNEYTEKLISARIPYLLFEDEYKTALRELVEFNYWDSYGANSEDFKFANRFILKIFDNAIENRDFETANKALKYFRSYYMESSNHKSLSGDPRKAAFHEAEDYNSEIKTYNEQIVTSLESLKHSTDNKELIKWFDIWIKPVYNCVKERTGNGLEEKWYVSGYDEQYIKYFKARLL